MSINVYTKIIWKKNSTKRDIFFILYKLYLYKLFTIETKIKRFIKKDEKNNHIKFFYTIKKFSIAKLICVRIYSAKLTEFLLIYQKKIFFINFKSNYFNNLFANIREGNTPKKWLS